MICRFGNLRRLRRYETGKLSLHKALSFYEDASQLHFSPNRHRCIRRTKVSAAALRPSTQLSLSRADMALTYGFVFRRWVLSLIFHSYGRRR